MTPVNAIHIGLAFDKSFITPFYVVLTSIFSNNKKEPISFHLIASGIDEVEKEKLTDFIGKEGAEATFYEIEKSSIDNLNIPKSTSYPLSAYYRLFFPSMVANVTNKLLYLDTDIVVNGNLRELYNISLENHPLAASEDMGIIGLYQEGKYFNTGVLLINVQEWISQRVSEKAIEFLNSFPEKIRFADQDALNFVLAENWKKFSNRYNITFNDIPPYMSKKKVEYFLKDKVIIHYTGADKPWSATSANRLRFLYYRYLEKSPHHFKKKFVSNRLVNAKNLFLFAKVRLIELLANFPFIMGFWKSLKTKM